MRTFSKKHLQVCAGVQLLSSSSLTQVLKFPRYESAEKYKQHFSFHIHGVIDHDQSMDTALRATQVHASTPEDIRDLFYDLKL